MATQHIQASNTGFWKWFGRIFAILAILLAAGVYLAFSESIGGSSGTTVPASSSASGDRDDVFKKIK